MQSGTVKWFDSRRGFGFITGSQGEDVFVHFSVIEGDGFRRLLDGEPVEYEVTRGPKGLLATRVRHLEARQDGKAGSSERGESGPDGVEDNPGG